MPILTPTMADAPGSEAAPLAGIGSGIAEALGGLPPPAGWPSADTLTRLANEMFATPPGGSLPSLVAPLASASPAPSEATHLADVPLAGAPGRSSSFSPQAHGAPLSDPLNPASSPSAAPLPGEAHAKAAASPHVPQATVPQPTSSVPPYFGGAHGLPLSGPSAPGQITGGPGHAETASKPASTYPVLEEIARGFPDIPGLTGVTSPGKPAGQVPASRTASNNAPNNGRPGSQFYFLDESNLSHTTNAKGGPVSQGPQTGYDVLAVRRDFPILHQQVNGRPLVWLDNAATTQKPQAVIDRLVHYYARENSNVHRGAHELAARSTDAYEHARQKVAGFIGANSPEEIIFVRGATEGINLVAKSWGRQNIGEGDEIIVTWLEHHANIVPWQQLCTETGAKLKVVPVDDHGQVLLDAYEKLLGSRTKLVAFTQVSNALGTVTPAKTMIDMAHRYGARVLLDGAQSVSHMPVNVRALDVDWFVLSGHKVFAPMGIGVVYGKKDLLDATQPWQGGGNMIKDVTFERTEYHSAPTRFEAGTGSIADAVGLGAAIDYLSGIGMDAIAAHEHNLIAYATKVLPDVPGLRIIGTAPEKAGVVSFVLAGQKSEAVGAALNQHGIAVRSGHHCAQPILRRFGLEATVRPSFALYNTFSDIDALVTALKRIQSGQNSFVG
ncbi:cysteine desulfurase, SufS subfamily [Rhodomicrobium vannielii ATCC 17100]|uniref:cysteine desulfurase n=1 Tax=Rhodomicrobium vannielii (strain ATCC 17100 / DSM 162 / LMG 4299 / NCIMB 10020 / ATH 3.1.1) TaxID=648757 RepID=E3I202_RHOVT|nr:family 2A encapsulin nanocompartment cargo protein cysteine desulfurase [Rhodomicrobium vannielii]ADP71303.1 cysteine desulfurase, SufS subfamily [Rhodomicrobium vannielii ATCC 17100]